MVSEIVFTGLLRKEVVTFVQLVYFRTHFYMHAADAQTLVDLEFDSIKIWLSEYCSGPTAYELSLNLTCSNRFEDLNLQLNRLNELRSIRTQNETFPAIDFEELQQEIKWLGIENAVISIEGFRRIYTASDLINRLHTFFERRNDRYPLLEQILKNTHFTTHLIDLIDKVFDRTGAVRDDASPQLLEIRQRIRALRQQINRNFERELRKLIKDKLLGDTTESFVNDRRVLTVQSTFKRKVPGNVHGSSKTGSLTYVEPSVNVPLNNEMEFLLDDERKEIHRILKLLTKQMSVDAPLIEAYQSALVELDFLNAKCKIALEMNAILPGINRFTALELIDAYHPLLVKNNKLQQKPTFPQYIKMDRDSRMLVISGPNAGGKSITLKTVGLLQVMLQSGLLVPVNENSKMCFFQKILSDIGDNQSIENELSTYSYRLQRMRNFLEAANKRSLLLLDEFGTGSDPELGGALAEVFFEELYKKQSFAVITTHYSNIKLKADELPQATNGCMQFDVKTLHPLYRLEIGQPGSSFTFEVARINGIGEEIIQEAKSRLSKNKVKLDHLLNQLQKEKNYLQSLIKEHQEAQKLAEEARQFFTQKSGKLDERLKSQQNIHETQNKQLIAGKKMLQFVEKFNVKSRKKEANNALLEEVRTYLRMEKSKTEIKVQEQKTKLREEQTKKSTGPKVIKASSKPMEQDEFQIDKITVGSLVQLVSTKRNGTVESIEGKKVTVIFDNARLKVELDKLRFLK